MDISIFLIASAGIFQGLANTIRKASSTTQHRATTITTTTMLVNTVISLPLLLYHFRLPVHAETWVYALLSGIVFSLSSVFFFKSYQHLDLSLSMIIQRLNIIFVAFTGMLFLGERLSPYGIGGLFLLFTGTTLILIDKKRIRLTRGAGYAIAASAFGALAAVLDKRALADFSPFTYAVINNLLVGSVFLTRKGTVRESLGFFRRYPVHILTSSFFGMGAFTVLMVILAQTQVSQTMPVYKTASFLVPVILGIVLYKETRKMMQKIVGTLLAVAGTMLIYS